jgi:alpha/beta superfamily hydrolase
MSTEHNAIFFHGLESSSKSDKADWLIKNYNAYCPDMDYSSPNIFQDMYNEVLRINPRILIGSSMGGWFAYCMSTLTGIRTLLMNPAFHSRSMEPKIRLGQTPAHHTVILGKNDDVINPIRSKQWIKKNGIGEFTIHMENNDHRTPLAIMQKYVDSAINEEWGTESPGVGAAVSILPEALASGLSNNFLASRPFQGGFLAVENKKELEDVKKLQESLSDSEVTFITKAHYNPVDVFYEYLVKRGYFISREEIKKIWSDSEANILFDKIKDEVKRPRPYWISSDIKTFPGVKNSSYSFPSAHSGLSWKIAIELSKKYPHLKDALETIARKIGESRVQGGVHYPIDVKAGEWIAKEMWNK